MLWFPAKDKEHGDESIPTLPLPRPYWDAGYSLVELVGFVQRESSFDQKTLRVATSEQLGSLMGDEEALRLAYEQEERWEKRNEGRMVYENAMADYLLGEVLFDGKAWHVALTGALAVLCVCLGLALLVLSTSGGKLGSGVKSSSASVLKRRTKES